MFIEALFTIAKTWKQLKCLSTDEWIKKMWYIYTVEYYSATKKNEIMPFAATWMDLEMIILSEVNQTEKNKYMISQTVSFVCVFMPIGVGFFFLLSFKYYWAFFWDSACYLETI